MSINNADINQLLKKKDKEITTTINFMEKSLLSETFDKSKVSFHFGRLEQLYLEFQSLLINKGILEDGNK